MASVTPEQALLPLYERRAGSLRCVNAPMPPSARRIDATSRRRSREDSAAAAAGIRQRPRGLSRPNGPVAGIVGSSRSVPLGGL